MMGIFKLIWLWMRNIFNSNPPQFVLLDYANYILDGKSYFVFSWEMKNSYRLTIKSAKYKSYIKSGSAYVGISDNQKQLNLCISNSWRSTRYQLKLKRINISEPIDFPISFRNNLEIKINIPKANNPFQNLKVSTFKVQVNNQTQIKRTVNISYPN